MTREQVNSRATCQFNAYTRGRIYHGDDGTRCPHGLYLDNAIPPTGPGPYHHALGEVTLPLPLTCHAGRWLKMLEIDDSAGYIATPDPGQEIPLMAKEMPFILRDEATGRIYESAGPMTVALHTGPPKVISPPPVVPLETPLGPIEQVANRLTRDLDGLTAMVLQRKAEMGCLCELESSDWDQNWREVTVRFRNDGTCPVHTSPPKVTASAPQTSHVAAGPACAGKSYEEHQDVTLDGTYPDYWWHCPVCHESGRHDIQAFSRRLLAVVPVYRQLQQQYLHQHAVILMPTEAATGKVGTFMDMDVIRVPGLAEPMIGVRTLPFAVDSDRLDRGQGSKS